MANGEKCSYVDYYLRHYKNENEMKISTKCQSKKNKSALYLYIHYIVML